METLGDLTEDWAAMKLRPDITGLPMAISRARLRRIVE
jgi:hypothetical protein